MRRLGALVFVAALVAAVPASAQDKRFDVNIGGGYTFALSDVGKYLGNGYNITAGATFNLNPFFGIQAEYSFNGLGQKRVDVPADSLPEGAVLRPIYGDMNMQYGDLNLVFKPQVSGGMRPYLIAGAGIYYRPVTVTTPSAGYVPPYCNPWYYVCWPGGYVEVDQVLGQASTTATGFDVGGGVVFLVTDAIGIYVEARYHYIWGAEIKNAAGTVVGKSTGHFLPIVAGIRF